MARRRNSPGNLTAEEFAASVAVRRAFRPHTGRFHGLDGET